MEENKNTNPTANEKETVETNATPKAETKENKTTEQLLKELQEENLRLQAENQAKDVSYGKLKKQFDLTSSEVSDYKKKWQSKLTEEEVKASELKEQQEAKDKEFEEMKRELSINKATKEYLAYGLNEENAEKCANAQVDGDLAFILKTLKADKEATLKKEKAEWLNQRPDPQVGGDMSAEDDPFLQGFKIGSR